MDHEVSRNRLIAALERHFKTRRSPRFKLGIVIVATGLAGFGISIGLHQLGLVGMWARYPVSVLLAYGVFLGLLRIWVACEQARFADEESVYQDALKMPEHTWTPSRFDRSGGWLDWLDVPDFELGEGCLPAILIAALVGLCGLLILALGGAPILIAELFADIALSGLLYRRLRIAAKEHWMGTAIRRTWGFVLVAAVLMGAVGFCLDQLAPHADSMGAAIREMREK